MVCSFQINEYRTGIYTVLAFVIGKFICQIVIIMSYKIFGSRKPG
jgi:hypothetical protein